MPQSTGSISFAGMARSLVSVASGINDVVYCVYCTQVVVVGVGGYFSSSSSPPFNRIAMWDGGSGGWSALGSGMDAQVYSITSAAGIIYAGGNFGTAGGLTANRVAAWNGTTWSANCYNVPNCILSYFAVCIYQFIQYGNTLVFLDSICHCWSNKQPHTHIYLHSHWHQ
jgi:hypothetical protein